MPFFGGVGVVAVVERRIRGERGDLSLEANDAVTVRLRRARRRDDAIGEVGVADGPLKGLLRTHRKADDRAQVRDLEILREQLMDRADVVADRHDRKARTVKRLRRVARRRRVAVAEQLRRDEIELRGVERAPRADQPLVAVVRRHVVRRQQHGVVVRRVQVAVRAVDDDRLREARRRSRS